MGRILMNVGFPADKNKIIQFVQKEQESNPGCRFDCKEILPLLQKIEERQYKMLLRLQKLRDSSDISDNNDLSLILLLKKQKKS